MTGAIRGTERFTITVEPLEHHLRLGQIFWADLVRKMPNPKSMCCLILEYHNVLFFHHFVINIAMNTFYTFHYLFFLLLNSSLDYLLIIDR